MGRIDGKVALVTGAARGQGRSHALRLAAEGADVIAIDVCAPIEGAQPTATPADLAETVRLVEALDRRIVAGESDVRDADGLGSFVAEGVAELGQLDVVVANAGIGPFPYYLPAVDIPEPDFRTMVDVNLIGVWNTCRVATPHLVDGASVILISSTAGITGFAGFASYSAAKKGVIGLGESLAKELGPRRIRVNTIAPGQIATDLLLNEEGYALFCPEVENPTIEDFKVSSEATLALPIPWLEVEDISNAVLFLASDESRYVTAVTLPVDAGFTA